MNEIGPEGLNMCHEYRRVDSVAEFIAETVRSYRESVRTRAQNVSSATLYRGQADITWDWSPSLYRAGLFAHERTLILDLLNLRPTEFAGLSDFAVLAKMQHYGLPTRLLDMTRNPLVGLYFACANKAYIDRDGSVAVFPDLPVLRSSNPRVEAVSRFALRHATRRVKLGRVLADISSIALGNQDASDVRTVPELQQLLQVPFHAIEPSHSNERIDRQGGAFLMLGMEFMSDKSTDFTSDLVEYGPLRPGPSSKLWNRSYEIAIPSTAKRTILEELSLLGVTRAHLFPDLANQASSVLEAIEAVNGQ